MVVGYLVLTANLGRFYYDKMRLTNSQADFAAEPDGVFFSWETLEAGRVQLVEGMGLSPIRIEGTPDMVLEVISPGSVAKDTQDLRELYWQAGIPEYWLIDPRGETPQFDILKYTAKG